MFIIQDVTTKWIGSMLLFSTDLAVCLAFSLTVTPIWMEIQQRIASESFLS